MRLRNVFNADKLVSESKYIINKPEEFKGRWNKVFNNTKPICLEIGMGKGDFIIDMAINNPDKNFIGIEKYSSIIVRAVQKLEGYNLDNLLLINTDALNLKEIFDKEIDTLYLNFSDPWPKKRHAKRRLTSSVFLEIYDAIFKGDCVIKQKTDNTSLFESSIVSLSNYGYVIEDISLDLWSTLKTYSVTEYENKFKNMGVKINYLSARKICKK